MRKTTGLIALLLGALLVTGCSKKKDNQGAVAEPPKAESPAVEPAQPVAEIPEAPANEDANMVNAATNCPSAAPGAETKLEKGEGLLTLMITGTSDESTAEIRKRATHLSEVQKAGGPDIQHTGKGTGGGELGLCPIVATPDAVIQIEEIEAGVKVTVKPTEAGKLAELEQTAEKRLQDLTRKRFGAVERKAEDHEPGAGGGKGKGGGTGGGGSKGAANNSD